MIAVIDYNAGNIFSVTSALEKLGFKYKITNDPQKILAAQKIIFPGQGRAGQAVAELKKLGIWEILPQIKAPFLGICLGMQLLFDELEEDDMTGLQIISGSVMRFTGEKSNLKVPQMGWNMIIKVQDDPLLQEIPAENYVYFANSYYVKTEDQYMLAQGTYGEDFAAIIRKDNFSGVQFHPEKSGEVGLQILKNFCSLSPENVQKTAATSLQKSSKSSFQIFPAIDLIGGKCVRLTKGDYDQMQEYSANPLQVAKDFVAAGASGIHIIDLEGAKLGKLVNTKTILQIAQHVSVPLQVGGGIRTYEDAADLLENGVERIILSTVAVENSELVEQLLQKFGAERILISVDVRDGMIAIKGWREESTFTLADFLKKLEELGIKNIIFTDIERDGTLTQPNFASIAIVLKSEFRVIIAGGISRIPDLKKLQALGAAGAIIGKAVYTGDIDLRASIAALNLEKNISGGLVKRIIPCMDIADGRVVKGTNFTALKDAGDPVELGKAYSAMGADELVFLDINATVENRKTLLSLVEKIAQNINIPFTVGGGIRSVADIRVLLKAGADKVSIGSAAVKNPELIRAASQEFGAQCLVISVDPKKVGDHWEIYIKGGREATGVDALEFAKNMEQLGAGELLVNSIDRDGMKSGYDVELLHAISESVSIPIIASSGAGKKEHFLEAFTQGNADAALAASLFHFGELQISEVKAFLHSAGVAIR